MTTPPKEPPEGAPIRAIPLDQARKARGEGKVAVPRSKLAATRAFRRVRGDRLFGVLGILLVLFGAYLVFNWEKPLEVTPTYPVRWPESRHSLAEQNPALETAQRTEQLTFEITDVNVTRISVQFSWNDTVGDEALEYDVLNFTVQGPAGSNITSHFEDATGPAGLIFLNLTVNAPPSIPSVSGARDRQEAATLLPDLSNSTGRGVWSVIVNVKQFRDDFRDAQSRQAFPDGDCPAGVSNPAICVDDVSQEVKVKFDYYTFAEDLSPMSVQPAGDNG